QVVLPNLDDPMAVVAFLTRVRGIIVHHIGPSIVVKENRWIYAVEIQHYRITPALPGVFGLYDHISQTTPNMCGDHIEGVVMGIVCDSRSVDSLAYSDLFHF